VLFNEDSEDDLIPLSDSNESNDSEKTEYAEIALIIGVQTRPNPKHRQASASPTNYSKRRTEYRHSEHWCYAICEFIGYK
jgi:hypothetical protein